MGIQSCSNPGRHLGRLLAAAVFLLASTRGMGGQMVPNGPALATPLRIPAGIAYDSSGNLYFAEPGSHVVRKVDGTGALTTVAGTGVQGFSGDGGSAKLAQLDSPLAVAVDPTGNILIADAHNHRIRKIDAASGTISTVVGTGVGGLSPDGSVGVATAIDLPSALALSSTGDLYFGDARRHVVRRLSRITGVVVTVAGDGREGWSGDGGQATRASIDSPRGIALDAADNLYLSDTRNQRVRRVDHTTGVIRTVAGNGVSGLKGDGGGATSASLALPRGLAMDSTGNLLIVDSSNHRLRSVDAVSGQIQSIAGAGIEGFAGDGSSASTARLDQPQGVAMDGQGNRVFSDTNNQRIRRIDGVGGIATIAGITEAPVGALTLTAPPSVTYGTGSAFATVTGGTTAGSVLFFDNVSGKAKALGTIALAGGVATVAIDTLSAGTHVLSATYAGDPLHPALESGQVTVVVLPATLTVTPFSATMLYGQPVPTLSGTFSGLLARDTGLVNVGYLSSGGSGSAPGKYPIGATLSGVVAADYTTVVAPAELTIARAPSLSAMGANLAVHVATTTSGQPSGTVSLLDGGAVISTTALSSAGDASFASTSLSNGSHTLSVQYGGDVDFLSSGSAPIALTIGASPSVDFVLASTGTGNQSVTAGSATTFAFVATPTGGSTASSLVLSASGLPAGAIATFSPAYLPPGSAPMPFTLTLQTLKTAAIARTSGIFAAMLLGGIALMLRRRGRRLFLTLPMLLLGSGCGDRVNTAATTYGSPRIYNITVTATGTSASGTTLLHSAVVTLTIQ